MLGGYDTCPLPNNHVVLVVGVERIFGRSLRVLGGTLAGIVGKLGNLDVALGARLAFAGDDPFKALDVAVDL